jgi:FAD/FMN-containing dehydrogenase/Fe-S oxidoreductase
LGAIMATTLARSADVDELSRQLQLRGVGDLVDASELTRALYSSDASLYRVVPLAVVRPRSSDHVAAVLDAARTVGIAVTTRGAGTSCAGNAVGSGVILDLSRHLDKIISIDPEARTAVVEPGVVQASLQAAAAPYGLRFGPDPSTHNRCTIGGMIGNNACGPRALGYGRTADNIDALTLITGAGERLSVGGEPAPLGGPGNGALAALDRTVRAGLGTIRTEFGRFGRQVSGYSLEHLLPERGANVARFLAGTEGTLGVTTQATVRLVADPPYKIMIVLGYPTMAEAADAAPAILPHSPTACEGIDRRIVDVVAHRRGTAALPSLPRGGGWMLVELVGDDPATLRSRADRLLAEADALDGFVISDAAQARALWKIREDGAGLAGVSLARPAYPGWEDAAVPPARLGSYLRGFDALLREHGLHGLPYGHFGDGCVHVRIDFPLTEPSGRGRYRTFVEEAAVLVASYGGSMSGEHGDGRARSALLPAMYSAAALRLFGQVKGAFDPDNLLNPGVLVDPQPVDADLRATGLIGRTSLFAEAVHRCSGVGKCLADTTAGLGVMCPSYQATREEKDSTRGRARVLQEMINGEVVQLGWRSPAVHEALDLCLSCKGCARDCPTGIDMAAYKSEVLDRSYRGRLRPRSHYALGWLPRWGRLITKKPALAAAVNLSTQTPGIRRIVRWIAGVDQRRSLPAFARTAARDRVRLSAPAGTPVVVWVDSFSDCFPGAGVEAAVKVLTSAGYAPAFLERPACCGLTWISTGQRAGARRQLRAALDVLHPHVAAGTPVIGLEPSCLAVWRSDARELLPDDPRVADVAAGVLTLAELLGRTAGWSPPDLRGIEVVAQPHCHHAAVLGWQADADLLSATGATVTTLGGCCGLAGNFGVERGHYEVSVKIAEHDLLPAVAARPEAVVLADGFSCRTQLAELADRQAITLAEVLAEHLPRHDKRESLTQG